MHAQDQRPDEVRGSGLLGRPVSRRAVLGGVAALLGAAASRRLLTVDEAAAASVNGLSSRQFDWQVDSATGGVFTLVNPSDGYGTNHVLNSTSASQFNVDDSRWFGDLIFAVRAANATSPTTMVTGLSGDIRTVSQSGNTITVSYNGTAANANGIRGFTVVETYTLNSAGTAVTWAITVKNTSGQALEFQDFGFPLLMNSYWAGGQTSIYEQNVSRHSFVAGDGSYIYWQRPNGVGPYLIMTPTAGTHLEYKNKARAGEGPFGEADPYWEGLVEFYVHSKNIVTQRTAQAGTYLPATSLTLAAGASQTYSFTFTWAANYAGLRSAIYAAGLVDVISLPGMVIPQGGSATLAVRASAGITSVTGQSGKNVQVGAATTLNGYTMYKLTFPTLGPNQVTVTYGGNRTTVLQYYSIRPVEELISTHAAFLVANQQAKTTHSYNGAFLQWDMATQALVTWDNYPGGGWEQWMAGGSDDLGLSPAEFLSEKNLISPVQGEISALDTYITSFLLGYLQSATSNGQRTWQVYRWYDGQDGTPYDTGVWRAYNYMHIANTYFNMYRIARAYPRLTFAYTAAQYLEMCFQTLNAMYNKIPQPTPIGDAAHTLGLMGESTYPDIVAALTAEGQTAEASQLTQLLQTKANYFASEAYPFASEQTIDTTGFESVYTLAKMFTNPSLAAKVQRASLACRGLQPLWYWYGSDNRSMGESWWNLSYETQLGAWQQQDYLQTYGTLGGDLDDTLRSTVGAAVGGWANINSGQIDSNTANIGAAAWLYQSEQGANEYGYIPNLNNWWSWSGEADLGFWGGLRAACVNVVNDGVVGLYAYNGDVTYNGTSYTIVPRDGVRQRFTVFPAALLSVSIKKARYTNAVVAASRSSIQLVLQNVSGGAYTATITTTNLPAGNYKITVKGSTTTKTVTVSGTSTTFDLPRLTAASDTVTIAKVGSVR